MGKKILIVCGICACYIAVIVFMTAMMPFWNTMTDQAKADPALSGNYATDFQAYGYALDASRLFPYGLATICCAAAVFVTLKAPELPGQVIDEIKNFKDR